jgi:hypothetical protein
MLGINDMAKRDYSDHALWAYGLLQSRGSRAHEQCFVYGIRTLLILVDFYGKSNVDC